MSTGRPSCTVASPVSATTQPDPLRNWSATGDATGVQQRGVKALAKAALARNQQRNRSATVPEDGSTKGASCTVVLPRVCNNATECANDDPLPDPAAEARRQRVLANPEVFDFSPPGDPANDTEALAERVAIMMEANGWDDATALREARWDADRERCWRAFLRNAQRVLQAPTPEREALLGRYRAEAERRYGEATGRDMALSLRGWVLARGVH